MTDNFNIFPPHYGKGCVDSSEASSNLSKVHYYINSGQSMLSPNNHTLYKKLNVHENQLLTSWTSSNKQPSNQNPQYTEKPNQDPWNWEWDEPKEQSSRAQHNDTVWNWSVDGQENISTSQRNIVDPYAFTENDWKKNGQNQHSICHENKNKHDFAINNRVPIESGKITSYRNTKTIKDYFDTSAEVGKLNPASQTNIINKSNDSSVINSSGENNGSNLSKAKSASRNSLISNKMSYLNQQDQPLPNDSKEECRTGYKFDSVTGELKNNYPPENKNIDYCFSSVTENVETNPLEVSNSSHLMLSNINSDETKLKLIAINSDVKQTGINNQHLILDSVGEMSMNSNSNIFSYSSNQKSMAHDISEETENVETLTGNKERNLCSKNSRKSIPESEEPQLNKDRPGSSNQTIEIPENKEITTRSGFDHNKYLKTGNLNEGANTSIAYTCVVPAQTTNAIELTSANVKIPYRMIKENEQSFLCENALLGLRHVTPGESSSPELGEKPIRYMESMESRVVTGVDEKETPVLQVQSVPLPVGEVKLSAETLHTKTSVHMPFTKRSEAIGSDCLEDYKSSNKDKSSTVKSSVVQLERCSAGINDNELPYDTSSYKEHTSKNVDQQTFESKRYEERLFHNFSESHLHASREGRGWKKDEESCDTSLSNDHIIPQNFQRRYIEHHDSGGVDIYPNVRAGNRCYQYQADYRKDYDVFTKSHWRTVRDRHLQHIEGYHRPFRDHSDRYSNVIHDRKKQHSVTEKSNLAYGEYFQPYDIYNHKNTCENRSQPTNHPESRSDFDYFPPPRRDYLPFHEYPCGLPGMDPRLYGNFYKFLMNLRDKNPAAYADWYENYIAEQKDLQHAAYQEDRSSVHSGKSSANDDRNSAGPYFPDFYRPPSSFSADFELRRYDSGQISCECRRCISKSEVVEDRRFPDDNSQLKYIKVASPERLTPFKFTSTHVKGVWCMGGRLLKILPNNPNDGQSAVVEIFNCQGIMNVDELKAFPGPLVKNVTHKKSVITYCNQKIKSLEEGGFVADKESAILIWKFFILLLTQNGALVGTDIAELLLSFVSESKITEIKPLLQPKVCDPLGEDHVQLSEADMTNKFRDLLLYGNKKEALAWAVKCRLWGHALFLSSKMDKRSHMQVMVAFANGIQANDPLQTLYQYLSGRVPAAVNCCIDENWGEWKVHLAMMISNSQECLDELDSQAYISLGDTLGSKGLLYASHFCYLMGQQEFGSFSSKSTKLVLIGAPQTKSILELATNEAIQMTEIYEYACQLADPTFSIVRLQVYKFIYATRLAECGMFNECMNYLEVISQAILASEDVIPIILVKEVYELAIHILNHAPFLFSSVEEVTEVNSPSWLFGMSELYKRYSDFSCIETSQNVRNKTELDEEEHQDETLTQNEDIMLENSKYENNPQYNEDLYMSDNQTEYWSYSSSPTMRSDEEQNEASFQYPDIQNYKSTIQSWEPEPTFSEDSLEAPTESPKPFNHKKTESIPVSSKQSWFGNIISKISFLPKNQMKLPDDKNPSIVWCPEKNRWTNIDGGGDDHVGNIPPPPKATEMSPKSTTGYKNEETNRFKMPKSRNARINYVDVLAKSSYGGNNERTVLEERRRVLSSQHPLLFENINHCQRPDNSDPNFVDI